MSADFEADLRGTKIEPGEVFSYDRRNLDRVISKEVPDSCEL